MNVSLLSFFSGSGLMDLAFEDAGYSIDFVNENHEPFLNAYQYSRSKLGKPEPAFGYSNTDIREFLTHKKTELDLVTKQAKGQSDIVGFIGGPPCPDFSIGGKNRGRLGEKGILSEAFIEIITTQKPHFFIFENVKGLWRTKKHRAFYEELKAKLEAANYILAERLINAIEYGVPQDRERIILIGFHKLVLHNLNLTFQLPDALPWENNTLYPASVVKEAWPDIDPFEEDVVREASLNVPLNLTVEHWFRKNDVMAHANAEHHFKPRAGLSKFLTIAEGDVSRKSFKRLHRWRYSPTAAYGNNEVHIHPYKARRISAAEALAIQSMPPEFELPPDMSLTNMFKTIGNGVPYLASLGIAKTLNQFLGIDNGTTDEFDHRSTDTGIEKAHQQAITLSEWEKLPLHRVG